MFQLDVNTRIALPIVRSVTALAQYPGPRTSWRYCLVDGKGLYRWFLDDVTPADGDNIIEPSGGSIGRWKRVSNFLESSSRFVRVHSTGDTTGAEDRAAIQAVLTAGKIAILDYGETYYLDEALEFASNSGLISEIPSMPAILSVAYTSALTATDRENAVLLVSGTLTDDVNTTLGADLFQGSLTLTAGASVPTAQAGEWLRIRGTNPADDFDGDSSENTVSEIVQIATSHTVGTSVTIQTPTFIHHDSAQALRSIDPVLDVVIDGVFVDVPAANTSLAVGLLIQDSARTTVRNFSARNLSRAVICVYGAKHITGDGITSRGTTNGTLLLETAHGSRFSNVLRTREGSRYHSQGYPQHEISMRAHCVGIQVDGVQATHAVGGIRFWGGLNCHVMNAVFDDLDITEACESDPDGDTFGGGTSKFGVMIDMGPSALSGERSAEFGFGNGCANIRGTNIRSRNAYGASGGVQPAVYLHDQLKFTMTNVSVTNIGKDVAAGGIKCTGMVVSDSTGNVDGLVLSGVDMGIRTQNVYANVFFDNVFIDGRAGDDTNSLGGPGIVFAHNGGVRCSPHFGKISIANCGGTGVSASDAVFVFAAEFVAAPDRSLHIDSLYVENMLYKDVRPASCVAHSFGPSYVGPYAGQFGTINASGSQPPNVAVATGPSEKNVIFATIPNNGWAMVAHGASNVTVTGGTPVYGDIIIAGADGYGNITGSPPAHPNSFFIATGQWNSTYSRMLCERRL
jgi:hypothetical protein